MSRRKNETERKLEELQIKAQQAEEKLNEIESREPFITRLYNELMDIRATNHVAPLWTQALGTPRSWGNNQ